MKVLVATLAFLAITTSSVICSADTTTIDLHLDVVSGILAGVNAAMLLTHHESAAAGMLGVMGGTATVLWAVDEDGEDVGLAMGIFSIVVGLMAVIVDVRNDGETSKVSFGPTVDTAGLAVALRF